MNTWPSRYGYWIYECRERKKMVSKTSVRHSGGKWWHAMEIIQPTNINDIMQNKTTVSITHAFIGESKLWPWNIINKLKVIRQFINHFNCIEASGLMKLIWKCKSLGPKKTLHYQMGWNWRQCCLCLPMTST